MATGKKWMKETKKLGLQEAQNYRDAIQELLTWNFFSDEYGWTGLSSIKDFLDIEILNKLNQEEKK